MTIYEAPTLGKEDCSVIGMIEEQRERLRIFTQHSPRRWTGLLRRSTFARAIQGSNTIEGYSANLDTALAAVEDEPPTDERDETWCALSGYRAALTYIMQAAQDPYFEFSKQFLKSLHFMMVGHDMSKHPGQWRPGMVYVVNSQTGETVYTPPETQYVNELVEELVDKLRNDRSGPPIVRAAMAHLNLTMIHPFKDGNGRLSRALQTLVLGQDGILHPLFSSIEEWLGGNTHAYYEILANVGRGSWNPTGDSLPWVRFCLKAHYQQAARLIRRNEEYEKLSEGIGLIVKRERLAERTWVPLFDAALGFRVVNSRYRKYADVTEYVAARDLRKLSELGLLKPKGEGRARTYSGGEELQKLWAYVRIKSLPEDPYEILKRGGGPIALQGVLEPEPRLPGL